MKDRITIEGRDGAFHAIDSSHVPMLSNPKLVIDVIRAAANA